ncbi:SGNH/GDSL hydrolase family protein [Streptomyces sp. PTM05]|uniref:SGNH/GDSL hydrolase family protein n=1 Tax=Streptantibioticus parmotrematis TaxID=2873249 RepID=A0ABS7QLR9_9ACTN|nr:SGNH/GDSL hydrolase family protein [Streptantibioticus parmotrematis]MBY8884126.1 SGNH/GDSL hydrolase family protein [Streptantibioticus parmotrematis]
MRIRAKVPLGAIAGIVATTVAITLTQAPGATAATRPRPPQAAASTVSTGGVDNPDGALPKGWKSSTDKAAVISPDSTGVHVLAAEAKQGYAWRSVTTLSEPGFDTDMWIGDSCQTDPDHLAVAYAPRDFTNEQDLMERGAFTAIVDLTTGRVTKLPFTATLAYFDPTCDTTAHTATFTQLDGDRTQLVTVDDTGKRTGLVAVNAEITSGTTAGGELVGATGNQLVAIDSHGKMSTLARGSRAPYDIHADASGGIDFVDQTGTAQIAKHLSGRKVTAFASAPIGKLALTQSGSAQVYLTGTPTRTSALPTGVTKLNARSDATISTDGQLAVTDVTAPGIAARVKQPVGSLSQQQTAGPVQINATVPETGKAVSFAASTGADQAKGAGAAVSPALAPPPRPGVKPNASGTSGATTDANRWCAVARNDPNIQALQPTPNQVEWAVDMAVRNDLHAGYITQGGWRSQEEDSTVDPDTMFPAPSLTGHSGAHVPAQVILGILAQESNLWQAEGGAIAGQTSSPLTSQNGFYGHPSVSGTAYWQIDWTNSDCGYGIGQITDGMRVPAHPKPNETEMPYNEQLAISLDYTVNIAKAVQLISDKWNEIHTPGQTITINNDDPSKIENWFASVWNYNEGFNAPGSDPSGNWGLGWYGNPANPIYPFARGPFMDTSYDVDANQDAAHPQDWPYEEKVMGWAAWSQDTGWSFDDNGNQQQPGDAGYGTMGFNPAWWNGSSTTGPANREAVKPPLDTFCTTTDNACDINNPPPCETQHLQGCDVLHWWHSNATWKDDCATTCGNESIKYQTLRSEPGRGHGGVGQPICSTSPLPSGTKVIDSLPSSVPTYRTDCAKDTQNDGSFAFTFLADSSGEFEARGDLHQVGGGYNAHFWYAHTRDVNGGVTNLNDSATWYDSSTGKFAANGAAVDSFLSTPVLADGDMAITGDWKLSQKISGYQRVWVHVPDTGSTAQQEIYTVHTGSATTNRVINAHDRANEWVSLGAIDFKPGSDWQGVTLTNYAYGATADDSIAWDAVAFSPLPGKPADEVTQLGDSYASGVGVGDYYPNSDTSGPRLAPGATAPADYDACVRSRRSWIRQTILPGTTTSIGDRDDADDPTLDFHTVACNGARTYDATQDGQFGEIPQLYSGFIGPDTTLIAYTFGGDDAGFANTLTDCVLGSCPSDATVRNNIDNAATNVMSLTELVHTVAPNARIVDLGYPVLFDTGVTTCTSAPLAADDLNLLASWGGEMNTQLASAMQTAKTDGKASFYDPSSEWKGHLICDSAEGLHEFTKAPSSDIASDRKWSVSAPASMESYHPNDIGASAYAKALQDALS